MSYQGSSAGGEAGRELSADVDWSGEIGDLLDELTTVQQELLDVLASKRDRIVRGELGEAETLAGREQSLADRLSACQTRRGELLAEAERRRLPSDSLRQLAASLERAEREPLKERVGEAAAQARLLQHHSLANWVLAQRSLLHVSQLIEIIATGGRLQPTYGNEAHGSSGALVDHAA